MGISKLLFIVAGALLAVVAAVYGVMLLGSGKKASPQKLAETALSPTAPPEKRVEAAAELAELTPDQAPAATQERTRVYRETPDPEVKAVMIQGIAASSTPGGTMTPEAFDAMESFLDAMDDESLLVRVRAHGAVKRLLQIDAGYDPNGPRDERLRKIQIYRNDWEKLKLTPGYRKFRERIEREAAAVGESG